MLETIAHAAERAFLDHARLALTQAAAVEAARRAAQPARKTFAIGFQTGHEMNWLRRAMHVLRDELKNIQNHDLERPIRGLAEALVSGRLDVAFLRVEPTFDLCYEAVDHEPLIVLTPSRSYRRFCRSYRRFSSVKLHCNRGAQGLCRRVLKIIKTDFFVPLLHPGNSP